VTTDMPLWLREANAAKARGEEARSRAADERALWIAKGVAELGHRGRQQAAAMLGVSVGNIDQALARARGLGRTSLMPPADEVLERLYALELAEMEPLPEPYWQVLRYIVRSTAVDVTWLEQPGELLAQEVEDLDPDELPEGVEQAVLAQRCRSWTRMQALAVLDTETAGAGDTPRS
jgi:cob(I)alamin adenosyltransferase